MKNLVELIEKVRVEESKLFGTRVYFEMKSSINDEWIDWEGDYISVDATPIYNNLDIIYPEDITEGKKINMEILRDLTGMDSKLIISLLKSIEEAWINKFEVIAKASGLNLTSIEINVGGEY